MTRKHVTKAAAGALLALAFASCARDEAAPEHADAEHDHHADEAEAEGGVAYVADRGLSLTPEVVQALDLHTTVAATRPLADHRQLVAQVFAIAPRVLASARVPAAEASRFERRSFTGATLVRIDRSAESATRLVDLIIAPDDTGGASLGHFVEVTLAAPAVDALAVPRGALLDAASGAHVYRVADGHFRRTPVETGARSADFVEITAGLAPGDTIAANGVEQLWLLELRLTVGGGHSH